MVKASDKIFKNLIESINDIVNDDTMNEARGRTATSARFINDKAPLMKLFELRQMAGALYHSPKKDEKNPNLPPQGLPDIVSYLDKNGFRSAKSKSLIRILEQQIDKFYNLFKEFKNSVENLPQEEDDWSQYLNAEEMPSEEEIAGLNTENDDLSNLDLEDDDDFEA